MTRDPLLEDHRLFALDADRAALQARLLHFAAKRVAAALRIDLLPVKILHVELKIGHAPRDPVVVADDYRRDTRQRDAGYVQPRRTQMNHVPGGRNSEFEMRIVGQNRLARWRTARPKRPTHLSPAAFPLRCAAETEIRLSRDRLSGACAAFRSHRRQLVVRVRYMCRPASSESRLRPWPGRVIEQT